MELNDKPGMNPATPRPATPQVPKPATDDKKKADNGNAAATAAKVGVGVAAGAAAVFGAQTASAAMAGDEFDPTSLTEGVEAIGEAIGANAPAAPAAPSVHVNVSNDTTVAGEEDDDIVDPDDDIINPDDIKIEIDENGNLVEEAFTDEDIILVDDTDVTPGRQEIASTEPDPFDPTDVVDNILTEEDIFPTPGPDPILSEEIDDIIDLPDTDITDGIIDAGDIL